MHSHRNLRSHLLFAIINHAGFGDSKNLKGNKLNFANSKKEPKSLYIPTFTQKYYKKCNLYYKFNT